MRILQFSLLLLFLGMYLVVKIPGGILLLKPWLPDLYGMGDLYRFSYLGEYRDSSIHNPPPAPEPETKTNLFVLGDSFAGPLKKEHYPGIQNYSFVNWNQFPNFRIQINPSKTGRNLLLIECSEKHIQLRFSDNEYKKFLTKKSNGSETGFQLSGRKAGFAAELEKWTGRTAVTDQNLHMLLFSNELVLRVKEGKAAFNRIFFGRIASEVEEYPPKKMLLQRMTTDTTYLYMSAFRPLKRNTEDQIIRNMKAMVKHFLAAGMDTVVFAFVPNPVSVIAPDYKGRTYNRLIPKLESRIHETGAGCISVFSEFSSLKEKVYRRGDCHWNAAGEKIWADKAADWVRKSAEPGI